MINNAPPSGNQADRNSLRGVMRLMLSKFLQRTDDMLPAKVIAYDPATNMAQVQPMIVVVTTDNQIVPRAQVASVPVYQISAGGFILKFPIKTGDLGWIKANDRDISIFMQSGAMSAPNTQRKHSFKDAMFYPQCMFDQVLVSDDDTNNVVLQNYAGTIKISMSETDIVITAPASVTVNAPTAVINSPTSVTIDTPLLTVTGILNVENTNSEATPCTINGNIVTNGDVIASSVSLVTHVHSGVQAGGSDTGPPV